MTELRDKIAYVIESSAALLSTGSDQQDHFRSVEIANNILKELPLEEV